MSREQTAALVLSEERAVVRHDAEAGRFVPASIHVQVVNMGGTRDTFAIEVRGLPSDWSTRSVPTLTLRPGRGDVCEITFLPPRPDESVGEHPFTIRVTPAGTPDGYAESALVLAVEAAPAATPTPEPPTPEPPLATIPAIPDALPVPEVSSPAPDWGARPDAQPTPAPTPDPAPTRAARPTPTPRAAPPPPPVERLQTAGLRLAADRVAVRHDPEARRFIPASLRVTIENVGTTVDQFNIEVIDLPPAWYTRSVPGMSLRPGVGGPCDIEFLPPRAPEAAAGDHPFALRVTPLDNPRGFAEARLTLTIAPFVETALALDPPAVATDADGATVTVALRNGGNLPLTYALSPRPDEAGALAFAFTADAAEGPTAHATVAPGEAAALPLAVTALPARGYAPRPGAYAFAVAATAVAVATLPPGLEPPPLSAVGALTLTPPAPVAAVVSPPRLELIELLAPEATCVVRVDNPSRRLVGVIVRAGPPNPAYELSVEPAELVLGPQAGAEVTVRVRRGRGAPLVSAPTPAPFQVALAQIDLPEHARPPALPEWTSGGQLLDPNPSRLPAPRAAPGTVVFTAPPPVELLIRPADLRPVTIGPVPARVELVDLMTSEAAGVVRVVNPSRVWVALEVAAEAEGSDHQIDVLLALPSSPLVLAPEATVEVPYTVRRAKGAALVASAQSRTVRLTAEPVEPPPPPATGPPAVPPGAPVAPLGALKVEVEPLAVVLQPLGLTLRIDPRVRRGGKGRFKVIVQNGGAQTVRAVLNVEDPDRDLNPIFGHQEGGFKAAFRRLRSRAAHEAESAAYRRISARAGQLAQDVGVPTGNDLAGEARGDDGTRRSNFPVVIDAGGKVEVPLEVRPTRLRVIGGSRSYPFKVTTAVEGQALEGQTKDAEFEHRPLPILMLLVILLLLLSPLFIIIPLKLGCARGTLEFGPYCLPAPAAAPAPVALRQEGGAAGTTRVALRDGVTLRQVASEPAAKLPGQFLSLVVPSPDRERVLYVTADDELLSKATLVVTDLNGNKNGVRTVEKGLWPAKPVWCQAPGGGLRFAYLTAITPNAGQSGLQLRIHTLGSSDQEDKVVLTGTTGPQGNGLTPELFYGRAETPLRWWDDCNALKYGDGAAGGKRWVIDLRGAAPGATEIRQFNVPGPQTAAAQAAGSAATDCEAKPLAQTDPRWAQTPIGKPGGPPIGGYGCALTAAAIAFRYYGENTDPNRLMTCAGEAADFFQWKAAADKCGGGRITATTWKENPTFGDIADAIRARAPAIVGLAGGPSGSHYVVVVEGAGEAGGDFRIQDPWDGTAHKYLSDYLETGGYRLKYLIRYDGTPSCPVKAGAAPAVRFTGIQDGATAQGPVKVEYQVVGGAAAAQTAPSGQTFDKEGFHHVGVTTADGRYHGLSFFIDKTPPKTTARFVKEKDKLAGALVLTAADGITPVAVTRIKLDSATVEKLKKEGEAVTRFRLDSGQEVDYTGDGDGRGNTQARGIPMEFTAVGTYRALVYSIDAAGNRETVQEVQIPVDGKLPTPQLVPTQVNFGRTDTQKQVQLSAADGVGELPWTAKPSGDAAAWLSVEPAEGVVKVGDQPTRLTIKIDRGKAPFGDFAGQIAVTSKTGATETVGTVEVTGNQPAPPTATPPPTPTAAQATQTAGQAAQATANAATGGSGAGVGAEEPVVEPAEVAIALPAGAASADGSFTVREKANVRMEWYVVEVPRWLELEIGGRPLLADPNGGPTNRILTGAGARTTVTVVPNWSLVRAANSAQGRIVIRDVSNRYEAVIDVTISQDKRSVALKAVPTRKR